MEQAERADYQQQQAEERQQRECGGCGINDVGDKFIWRKEADGYHRIPRCDDCVQALVQGSIKIAKDSNDPRNWREERQNQAGWLGHTFTQEDTQ